MNPKYPPGSWRRILWVLGSLGIFAFLQYFGTGLNPVWWVTWFAPLPILVLSSRLGGWSCFFWSTLAFMLGGANLWHFMVNTLGTPALVLLVLLGVSGCAFGLSVVCFQRFLKAGAPLRAIFGFSSVWVIWEYLNLLLSPHGTSLNLSYTQMDNLLIIQLASLTGVWGISFCLLFVPATLAVLLHPGITGKSKQTAFLVMLGLMVSVLIYAGWRLSRAHSEENPVMITLLASDSLGLFPREDGPAVSLLQKYAKEIGEGKYDGASMIVLPEKIALVSDQAIAEVDALFQSTAQKTGASIVVGVDRGTLTKRSNEARVYSPEGVLVGAYVKHYLLPPLEAADVPGDQLLTWEQGPNLLGFAICKDMDFPGLSRQYGGKEVGLLIVPAWDFQADGWLHSRMAIMRGIENGFAIARNAKQGRLTISDECGRILGETTSDAEKPFSTLKFKLPVQSQFTLYRLGGDWFAWVNVVGLLVMLIGRRKPIQSVNHPE